MSMQTTTIASLVLLPALALAQVPVVTFSQGVTEVLFETPGVYDFSRNYVSSDPDGSTVSIGVTHDADGRLSGFVNTVNGNVDIRGTLTGKVRTVEGTTLMKETLRSRGTTTGGKPDFRSIGVTTGRIAGLGGGAVLISKQSSTACIRMKFGGKAKTVCNKTVLKDRQSPFAHAGDWRVRLAFDASGTDIAGTGTITVGASTDDARSFEVLVNGRFDPATGDATLTLEPTTDAGLGTVTIQGVVVPNTEGDRLHAVHEVKGRLLGQKFNEAF